MTTSPYKDLLYFPAEMTWTISNRSWVVIPAGLGKKDLLPTTQVVITDYGDVVSIVPAHKRSIKQGRAMLKGLPSLTQDLQKEGTQERVCETWRAP